VEEIRRDASTATAIANGLIGSLAFLGSIELPVYPGEEGRTIGRSGHVRSGQAS
jgi:hypothetical protein